ncbi:MAG: HRDC domain-containing protein [Syntrophaceae bacterium]|nr:MAG: HRDC domain-containing protein [Syntrophaceae bacterium]
MNAFLRSVRALTIDKEFVSHGENSVWCLAVEYLPQAGEKDFKKSDNRNKTDYREILSAEDFVLFVKLRDWRKQAAVQEAVPVYTIFTNEQLAAIAQKRTATLTDLKTIDGVGESRAGKYGDAIMKIVGMEKTAETGGQA